MKAINFFLFLLILLFTQLLISFALISNPTYIVEPLSPVFNSLIINLLAFIISLVIIGKFKNYLQQDISAYFFPTIFFVYLFLFALIFLGHLAYSIKILFFGLAANLIFILKIFKFFIDSRQLKFLVVPSKDISLLKTINHINFVYLSKPIIPRTQFDGIIVNFDDKNLSNNWQSLIALSALKNIPVYDYKDFYEKNTGKVSLDHLTQNDIGGLLPSELTTNLKRFFDLSFIVIFSPIIILLILIIGFLVKIDNPGSVFFLQKRVGYKNKKFTIIKFRSISKRKKISGSISQKRYQISNFGKFMRKHRLDEIPQFWNVLRGEMSLIGPRPEIVRVSKKYEELIPLFVYRHVVRPGITGWAQVQLGYVTEFNFTKEKLAYDLYYIKHFSFWMDFLVWFKTLKTIATGFGSK